MNQGSKNNSAVIGIIAVVIIGAIVAGTILLKPKDGLLSTTSNTTASTSSDTSGSSSTATNFKDGTYTSSADYSTPGGNEQITVTITVSGNKISDSTVTGKSTTDESAGYRQDFVDNYKDLVVGKLLSQVRLSRVAGSSLTSNGFNEALDAIRNKAQS